MDIEKLHSAMAAMNSMNIHGKDYTMVAQRVEAFRKYAGLEWSITSEILEDNERRVLMRAQITDRHGFVVADGLAEELRGQGVNRTSAIENAQTSAWGRALANLGLHGGKMATVEEIDTAKHNEAVVDKRAKHTDAEHDAAVRAERNQTAKAGSDTGTRTNGLADDIPFPPPEKDTKPSDESQRFTDYITQELKKCTATFQIKQLAEKYAGEIKQLKQNRPDLQAELLAFSKVRFEQLNDGAR